MSELITVISANHHNHHIREKDYYESPRRLAALTKGLSGAGFITPVSIRHFADKHVTAVHTPAMVSFLKKASSLIAEGKYEYPYLYPLRNSNRPPKDWSLAVGYHCFDSFTPIHRFAYEAAREAVDATLTAASSLLKGKSLAYAMVRPPGHHAERNVFGGFCYLNSSAIAANYLSAFGKVAMLDIDYHHGNGQQNIFWERKDVLTISIHGEPSIAYPYFSGFEEEKGGCEGEGFNINFPMPEVVNGSQYRRTLRKAIANIRNFDPDFLVVPLGFDTAQGDPTGSWLLEKQDFFENGRLIGAINRPTVFVQEGGYKIGALAGISRSFFDGVISVC